MSAREVQLIDVIRAAIIGDDEAIDGPFGVRRVVYADYTASGRSLGFIEEFLRTQVMPFYANTHTESSGTGLQTTRFREDARQIIHRAVGGGPDDVVIFAGSGATGAINLLMGVLGLRLPSELDRTYGLKARIPADERPVVFIGPYEHHANELPWRESIADVVTIREDADGHIDVDDLEANLLRYAARPLKIGSFSAASNVTGIVTQTGRIAALLHAHGAHSFWDYAAAGPYVKIDLNPAGAPGERLDAVFISPHKFIGGPGTPGVLVAKRALFRNTVPVVPAGGTVSYVGLADHRYLSDTVHREEAGTPAILESIRAGLVFQLKEAVGCDTIREREESFIHRAIASWSRNPRIRVFGNPHAERLSIVSMAIHHDRGYLHWNYVVALLNDLLGIQARGGCSCAGPYGHRLYAIDEQHSKEFDREVARGYNGIKPGWFRINFNYFISETVFEFLVEAVHLVADHGWKLLPQYTFEPKSGLWSHRSGHGHQPMTLQDVTYDSGKLEFRACHRTLPESALPACLEEARRIFAAASTAPPPDVSREELPEDFERLRWFPLPSEVLRQLKRGADQAAG